MNRELCAICLSDTLHPYLICELLDILKDEITVEPHCAMLVKKHSAKDYSIQLTSVIIAMGRLLRAARLAFLRPNFILNERLYVVLDANQEVIEQKGIIFSGLRLYSSLDVVDCTRH